MDWRSQFEMFMPHGMCLLWRPELMLLHIISDGLIALAYFTIPIAILRFVRGRNDLERGHVGLAVLFAAFIAFCGLTHVASVLVLWVPVYIIEGWLKAATAVVSVATAGWLIALVPQALKLPSVKAMQREIVAHRETMAALDAARAALAAKVDSTEGELRAAQYELLQMSRRTAMGDMATTLAHEINQPLSAISMYLGGSLALLKRDSYEGPLVQSLNFAKEQCLRAGEIISRARSFVTGDDVVKRTEKVSNLIEEACNLALVGARDGGVATIIEHEDPDIPVLVDRVQIEQVVVNLVTNAMDAMDGAQGGALRIKTGYDQEGMAMVSVSDSGPGVSPEVIGRLFEPFVSTKGVKGMGVGLSICRAIIENHGGKIWADADADRGATFHFTLPPLDRELAA